MAPMAMRAIIGAPLIQDTLKILDFRFGADTPFSPRL
jgi:hypothetical protein